MKFKDIRCGKLYSPNVFGFAVFKFDNPHSDRFSLEVLMAIQPDEPFVVLKKIYLNKANFIDRYRLQVLTFNGIIGWLSFANNAVKFLYQIK
jgi:hypothetical protein